ncbi:putative uncharacterized protein [Burkholderiales bacterium GJ-E10]|nr:putative uncharacterized protein [Burkholderiales bacterium GJ-E10]
MLRETLDLLRRRFADDDVTDGYRKDGPVSVANFELGEGVASAPSERRNRTTLGTNRIGGGVAIKAISVGMNKHLDATIPEPGGARRGATALWALFTHTLEGLAG